MSAQPLSPNSESSGCSPFGSQPLPTINPSTAFVSTAAGANENSRVLQPTSSTSTQPPPPFNHSTTLANHLAHITASQPISEQPRSSTSTATPPKKIKHASDGSINTATTPATHVPPPRRASSRNKRDPEFWRGDERERQIARLDDITAGHQLLPCKQHQDQDGDTALSHCGVHIRSKKQVSASIGLEVRSEAVNTI